MSKDNKYTINDLISSTIDHKPLDVTQAFNYLIKDRIVDALDVKKMEIAQGLYSKTGTEDDGEAS